MEKRKQQFFGFVVILLIVGFLQYFRKIANGYKLTKTGKILYLCTMVTFTIGIMFLLYFTEVNNIIAFCIGLIVTNLSENIAKMFIIIGDSFNPMLIKILKRYTGVDFSDELKNDKHE